MRDHPNSAIDPTKRELFGGLAQHHKVMADRLEKVLQNAEPSLGDSVLGRKSQEPVPCEGDHS